MAAVSANRADQVREVAGVHRLASAAGSSQAAFNARLAVSGIARPHSETPGLAPVSLQRGRKTCLRVSARSSVGRRKSIRSRRHRLRQRVPRDRRRSDARGHRGPPPRPWAGVDVAVLPSDLRRGGAYMAAIETFGAAVTARGGRSAGGLPRRPARCRAGRSIVAGALLPVVEADGMWAAGGSKSFALWVAAAPSSPCRPPGHGARRALGTPARGRGGDRGAGHGRAARILAQLGPTTEQRRDALAAGEWDIEAFWSRPPSRSGGGLRRERRWAAHTDPDATTAGTSRRATASTWRSPGSVTWSTCPGR